MCDYSHDYLMLHFRYQVFSLNLVYQTVESYQQFFWGHSFFHLFSTFIEHFITLFNNTITFFNQITYRIWNAHCCHFLLSWIIGKFWISFQIVIQLGAKLIDKLPIFLVGLLLYLCFIYRFMFYIYVAYFRPSLEYVDIKWF